MLWSLLLLTACKGGKDDPTETGEPGDTESTTDTGDSGVEEPCEAKPAQIWPEDEADDHYVRDPVQVLFTQPAPEATFTLESTEGDSPELSWEFNASDELATLAVTLEPKTIYVLGIDVCDAHYEARFKTSAWGTPLAEDPSALAGRTFAVELGDVDFTEPPDIGNLLALYLDVPILLGVEAVAEDGQSFNMLGARGFVDGQGVYRQRKKEQDEEGQKWSVPTWDFAEIDFSESPFFAGDAAYVELAYGGETIPVHDFHLEATFAQDGMSFGEGRLWGLADTRNLGRVVDPGAENTDEVVCDLVGGAGISCEPCPGDDAPYCLFLRGENIDGQGVPGLTLERIETAEPVD